MSETATPDADDAVDAQYWLERGYLHPRRLESGEIAALAPFLFTVGLCVGLVDGGYRTRFCYPDYVSAIQALIRWDGYGHPDEGYLAQKGMDMTILERPD